MTASTAGIEMQQGSRRLREAVELLSSMRFAIALLTVICIASVIGTVLKQHEPYGNYVNQFGPFWADVFGAIQLYSVYSAWWFLLILAFLVISTSLCIARNTPKILSDLRQFKENIREQSLKAFGHHHAEADLPGDAEAVAQRVGQGLTAAGWKVRLQRRDTAQGAGWMVAAKAGSLNKIGYLAAHSAIVLICLGGLFDGDLIIRAQTWFNGKEPYKGAGLVAQVPPKHRLSDRNPTFRGNLMVAEGESANTAILAQPEGVLLQELPFDVELKKFNVEYYSTGMPKLFASDIVIHDRYTGQATPARVEVNHPFNYHGVEIYQSSFDDGGSLLRLQGQPLTGNEPPLAVEGRVGASTALKWAGQPTALEFAGLRVINVENMGPAQPVDTRKVDWRSSIESHLGAGNKSAAGDVRRNVGPSFSYKLRDASGQAREYNNYMQPVNLDGARVFLLGVRDTPAEAFRYLRVPADEQDSLDGFLRARRALADPALRAAAVRRYAAQATDSQRGDLTKALAGSAERALNLYAGVEAVPSGAAGSDRVPGGLPAVSRFIETHVPAAERERAGDVLLRILNGTLFELVQLTRERAGQKPLDRGETSATYMTQLVVALSDSFYYPATMVFELKGFEQVQASVFQVVRSPGKTVVYLGCLFLILGVFAMLYVRERRVWVWVVPRAEGGVQASLALSSNRQTMDADREFATLKTRLLEVPQ